MEIQFQGKARLQLPDSQGIFQVIICYPVNQVDDDKPQTKLFDTLSNPKLDQKYIIQSLDDFLNPFAMFEDIFSYVGYGNFPSCDSNTIYMVINKELHIKKSVFNKFKDLIATGKNINGNARQVSTNVNSYFVYEKGFDL
jgi:hypothetical protein